MLSKLDKVAPYLAAVVLAYLAYTVMEAGAMSVPPGKDAPALTKTMLHPQLIVPKAHASPADRDPFEVSWASYLRIKKQDKAAKPENPAGPETPGPGAAPPPVTKPVKGSVAAPAPAASKPEAKPEAASKPEAKPEAAASKPEAKPEAAPAPAPPPPEPPPLPAALGGVFVSRHSRMAVIDDCVYQVGEWVKGADPAKRWRVDAIEEDHIVLRFGDVRQTLRIPR